MTTGQRASDPRRLANHEVATYALWRAGGAGRPCDTEDVAVLCWELAPQRFSWKNYAEFPDKDTVRVALSDAKKKKYGGLVQGSGEEGWLLTTNGIRWIEENIEAIRTLDSTATSSRIDREGDRQLRQAREHGLYTEWRSGADQRPRYYDIADLVQLPADAPQDAVNDGLSRLENLAEISGDQQIKEFLAWVRTGIAR